MTVDKMKLQRLAEKFPQDLDLDSNDVPFSLHPEYGVVGGEADGTYSVYGKPFRLEGEDYDYDGPVYVERCSKDFAQFMVSAREGVLALLAELATVSEAYVRAGEREHELRTHIARLKANSKLKLCDYPAIHKTDLDLLLRVTSGVNQSKLAKIHGCTAPNINRKIRRVKQRLGWKPGMTGPQIKARAQQLRDLAKQGAVVAADLIDERDRLQAENEALRQNHERYQWLRARDLDTIHKGGVFAGITPENLVINEETLDQAIDAAMAQAVLA